MAATTTTQAQAGEPAAGRRAPKGRTPTARGGTFAALRFRNYRLFWFGQLVSVTGTFMQGTAQQWLVLTLSPNPLALGLVGAFQFAPLLLLAPFGGIIADRFPRRRVLMATQTCAALLAFTLWILTATDLVQLWHVYVLALGLGLVNAVDMPTRQAFVSEMVGPESLLNAVSLNSAQFNVSRIFGPGLAGVLIALFGVPFLFLGNALSFIAVIAGLAAMRPTDLFPVPRNKNLHGFAQIRALGEGVSFIRRTPVIWVTLVLIGVTGTFGYNFNVLIPLEATTVLHAGPEVFGLLSSALGAGALVGALLLARRRRPPTNALLIGGAAIFGILEMAGALTNSDLVTTLASWITYLTGWSDAQSYVQVVDFTIVAMILIALTGLFMSMFSASANTRTQLSSPPELRGRVMSIYMMLFAGTTPIGNLAISAVAATPGGISLAWAAAGLPCFLVAILAAILWRRYPVTKPTAAPAAARGELGTIGNAAVATLAPTLSGKTAEAEAAQVVAQALSQAQTDDQQRGVDEQAALESTPELID